MSSIFEFQHMVDANEIDELGHVHNVAYLKWMNSAAVAHSAACGWPTKRYLESGGGWVVRSHQIEYRSPALADDAILVRTWIADFKKVTSRRRFEIIRPADERLLATAETVWVYVGFEHGFPRRIPAEVIEDFGPPATETKPKEATT